ncbi:MAG: type 2 lanthipeptide synthetase LanM family protein [Syntrophomonas sp.]|nr:type 2 lanthipeptide synthetase LanM family protein [Syntrophomonas sp.]
MISESALLDISIKSTTAFERINNLYPNSFYSENCNPYKNQQMERWCLNSAKGDWDLFQQRLSWDNIDINSARKVLEPGFQNIAQSPPWLQDFTEILKSIESKTPEEYRFLFIEEPVAFEEFFAPLVAEVSNKIGFCSYNKCGLLSYEAIADLERQLLIMLSEASSHTLLQEFYLFRQVVQYEKGVPCFISNTNKPKREIYKKFSRWENFLYILAEYPVLVSLIANIINNWLSSTERFLLRLQQDIEQITKLFNKGETLGEVTNIRCGLSDRHNGGQTAAGVLFANGLGIIYKPKDVGLEKRFFGFLAWLKAKDNQFSFKVLDVYEGKGYGWVEYLEHLPCNNEEEVKEYYRRAGQLTTVLYLLGSMDCHYQNIIASGDQPVLVDMETLLSARFLPLENQSPESELSFSYDSFYYSVLGTMMMPSWKFHKDNAYDMGGLTGPSDRDDPFTSKTIKDINTDEMRLENIIFKGEGRENRPVLQGKSITPEAYIEELVEGFTYMYRFLLSNRLDMMKKGSPLELFSNTKVRVLCRDTATYVRIIEKSLAPECLRDGAERSISLEVLCRAFVDKYGKPDMWPILGEERRAIEQLDIPYFSASSTGTSIFTFEGQEIKNCLKKDFISEVYLRLDMLSEKDLKWQAKLIKESIICWSAGEVSFNKALFIKDRNKNSSLLERADLIRRACLIAKEIKRTGLYENGELSWVAPNYTFRQKRYQIDFLENNLFQGRSGIALFLAALRKVTGENYYTKLVEAVLKPLLRIAKRYPERIVTNSSGIEGSVIYALVRIGRFMEDQSLLDLAGRLREYLIPKPGWKSNELDVVTGLSGAVLGLLSLYQVSEDPSLLRDLNIMGNALLNNQPANIHEYRIWQGKEKRFQPGFAHGVSGIAFTLLKLYGTLRESSFLEASRELLNLECTALSCKEQESPTLDYLYNASENENLACSWCSGLMGVGMAALELLKHAEIKEAKTWLDMSVKKAAELPLDCMDTLYSGNFGRADFLITAAKCLHREDLTNQAESLASQAIIRSNKNNGFGLYSGTLEQMYHPGMFTGTAGIGYQLLRIADPELVPSVLFFE